MESTERYNSGFKSTERHNFGIGNIPKGNIPTWKRIERQECEIKMYQTKPSRKKKKKKMYRKARIRLKNIPKGIIPNRKSTIRQDSKLKTIWKARTWIRNVSKGVISTSEVPKSIVWDQKRTQIRISYGFSECLLKKNAQNSYSYPVLFDLEL